MTYRDNPEIARKYKSKRWQKLRKEKLLLTNGLCERCLKKRVIYTCFFCASQRICNKPKLSR